MPKKVLLPIVLVLLLLSAACGGTPTSDTVEQAAAAPAAAAEAVESAAPSSERAADMEGDEQNAEAMADDEMDADEMDGDDLDSDMDISEHDDDMDEVDHDAAMTDADQNIPMEDSPDLAEDADGAEMALEAQDAADTADLPTWQTIPITSALTGEQFTLADLQGNTVFVEAMATWCTNCRQQQGIVRDVKAQTGDDVRYLMLSVETTLPPEQLAAYSQSNGFDFDYAVMPVELLQALSDEFGRTISNPPSTPHFLLLPDGRFTSLATGIHSADEILAEIAAN